MICKFCDKDFSNVYNLKKHQKRNICSQICAFCNVTYPSKFIIKHSSECPDIMKSKIIELEKENLLLKERFDNISRKCSALEYDNERYIKQIIDLQGLHNEVRKLNRNVKKAVKQKPQIINVNQNIKIDNLQILDFNDFSKYASQLTIEHIKKGVSGYAEFALAYPLNNKIVCTDFARRKIKYKTNENQLANDFNFNVISSKLFNSIDSQNRTEILKYGNNYINSVQDPDEKMRLYSKFLNYIEMVRDVSNGIKHNLFPEFVKEICTMSNNNSNT